MTSPTLKPIETRYKGYRFRSRLEARWAVAFDAMEFRWAYEPEGFTTPFGGYLPDFLVNDVAWAEVKPTNPALISENEWARMEWFAKNNPSKALLVLCGEPRPMRTVFFGRLDEHHDRHDVIAGYARGEGGPPDERWERAVAAARAARFER